MMTGLPAKTPCAQRHMRTLRETLRIELNPTPETRELNTRQFASATAVTASDASGRFTSFPNCPSRTKDTARRRRHPCHCFGPGPRSSPEAAQRGVEDAGLEVGRGPKDHMAGRPFSGLVAFIPRDLGPGPVSTPQPGTLTAPDLATRLDSPRIRPVPDKPGPNATVACCRPAQ